MNIDWENALGGNILELLLEGVKPLISYIFSNGLISLPVGAIVAIFLYKRFKKKNKGG